MDPKQLSSSHLQVLNVLLLSTIHFGHTMVLEKMRMASWSRFRHNMLTRIMSMMRLENKFWIMLGKATIAVCLRMVKLEQANLTLW